MKVRELVAGDVVEGPRGEQWMFVGRSDHPKYPGLQLVVWTNAAGKWSLDALDPMQEVGDVISDRDLAMHRLTTRMPS